MSDLVLDGASLTNADLVRVARGETRVSLAPDVTERMGANRAFIERVAERGDAVYGLTTGVGVRKRQRVDQSEMAAFARRLIADHATGQGPPLPDDVARAATVLLVNTLAAGRTGVRPEIAERIVVRINEGAAPRLRRFGSTGMGDVGSLADLVIDLLGDVDLARGEALALIGQSSVTTAHAALSLHDASRLLDAMTVLTALDLEAFAAPLTPLDPLVAEVRPYPGLVRTLAELRALLTGSRLWDEEPRHPHGPLAFRNAAPVLGAARDALAFAERQVGIELNAHQQNPLHDMEHDRTVPVANFEMLPVAQALDIARLALGPCIAVQTERTLKLLQAPLTGLSDGLEPPGDPLGHGLSEFAWPLQALGAEARLLVQPVSAEIPSATQAEGIEDRMTLAPLGARRLDEQRVLANRLLSIAALCACQAIDLRGVERLGAPLAGIHTRVRSLVPPLEAGVPVPGDLEPLVAAIDAGLLSA